GYRSGETSDVFLPSHAHVHDVVARGRYRPNVVVVTGGVHAGASFLVHRFPPCFFRTVATAGRGRARSAYRHRRHSRSPRQIQTYGLLVVVGDVACFLVVRILLLVTESSDDAGVAVLHAVRKTYETEFYTAYGC
ncbi:unnamed protein product, partial [Ectocarpus sp. 8 AP-2014]